MAEEKSLKEQLEETQQTLKRTERQLEKSQSYNEELRQQIETLSAELHSYRNAAQHRSEVGCQVEEKDIAEAYGDKPFPDWCSSGQSLEASEGQAESSTSIADSLKAAAEEVVWKEAGFVYDSASGLYYNYDSGYYYDSARSLYYDPSTTSYFYYDETEQTYKFHSYASEQYNEQSLGQGNEETTTLQNNAAAPQRTDRKHSSGREKRRTHKDREKAKVQKRKVLKARRRTKSSKHKSKMREKKKKANSEDDLKSVADSSAIVVEDSDEGDKDENKEKGDETKDVEVMEIESSDSLATGESEMESEPESGELTDQSSSSEDSCVEFAADPVEYDHVAETVSEPEVSASYPPCVRVVVQASDVVDVGTFFLITCTGGTIGRDKDPRHVIQIQDVNISKVHAEIKYDHDNSCYTVEDLGSQNGTFVNDLRISQAKEKSAAIPLTHGDALQVASTKMLLHIHPGSETCDNCEPGQVLAALRAQQTVFNEHVILTKEERKKQARQEMKKIKKKYGLANSAYVDNAAALKNPDYADKADLRRRFVGSEHPSHKKRQEAPASVHRPISAENKGHRMLAKMGWKEGSGLGKDSAGRAEPVNVELRANQTAGLGSTSSVSISLDDVQSAHKTQRLLRTQERYQRLENSGTHRSDNGTPGASATSGKSVNHSRTQRSGNAVSTAKSLDTMQTQWIRGETQQPP